MPQYLLHNTHRAEECRLLDSELAAYGGTPVVMQGHEFFCTCPTGDHGGYVIVEADTETEALEGVPPKFRAGSRLIAGEVLPLS